MSITETITPTDSTDVWFEMRSPLIPDAARRRVTFDLGETDVAVVVPMVRVDDSDVDW
jgi:hypothetical protein